MANGNLLVALPNDVRKEIAKYLSYDPSDYSSIYHYYTKIRSDEDGIIVSLHRIIERESDGTIRCRLDENFVPITFKDTAVFNELPPNLGNYYTWAAIQIKKYLQNMLNLKEVYKCSFYHTGKLKATIVIDCGSDHDTDDPLFQY